MKICPSCTDGTVVVHRDYRDPKTGRRRGEWLKAPCTTCGGTMQLADSDAERIEKGEAVREERADRGVTLREEAKRLSIDPRLLSDVESGRATVEQFAEWERAVSLQKTLAAMGAK